MYRASSNATPKDCPPSDGRAEDMEAAGGELRTFDWVALVPRLLHPVQVAIIEALTFVDRPLSATQMTEMFGVSAWYRGIISYHLAALERAGVIDVKATRQVRGAREKFYFFTEPE